MSESESNMGQIMALAAEIDALRARCEAAEAANGTYAKSILRHSAINEERNRRIAELEEALKTAWAAMCERRGYSDAWEWKYGKEWDVEDAEVEQAITGKPLLASAHPTTPDPSTPTLARGDDAPGLG